VIFCCLRYFFFSSRRRHTRFSRDWSSDVCSSDLVPTLDGRATIQIPAGTQTGKVFRLRGKGVTPVRGGPPGDLLCRVRLETPVNLTKEQRELLEKFAATLEAGGEKHNPQSSSWLDGVKKFFEDLKF